MTLGTSVLARVQETQKSAYEIRDATDIFGRTNDTLARALDGRRALLCLSPTISRRFGDRVHSYVDHYGLRAKVVQVASGEAKKDIENVLAVCDAALAAGLDRRAVLVGIGGGTVLDVVGFAASMYRRGIPHIRIGSTLLAQVDASVGVKTGVNAFDRKNFIGAFHAPESVLIDTSLLQTLEVRQVRAGLAEILKLGIVCDIDLLNQVDRLGPDPSFDEIAELSRTSAVAMADALSGNLFESELRRPADFGHTLSPLLETSSSHRLNHGEAVSIDIAVTVHMATKLGLLSNDELTRTNELMRRLRLPQWDTCLTPDLAQRAIDAACEQRAGLNMPLPDGLGHSTFVLDRSHVTGTLVRECVNSVRRL